MKVSVIVCTRNRHDLISDCLDALCRNGYNDLEILVIDQSTDCLTSDIVLDKATADSRIRLVPTTTIGLSRARNTGIKESRGDVVAFTDDDCVPADDWVERIVGMLSEKPSVSAVYGRSLPWNKVWPGERPVAIKTDRMPKFFTGRRNPWKIGHGCNMAFRGNVLSEVGAFDEALGPGGALRNCDDADFTYRLLAKGLAAYYEPEVLVYHKQFRHGEDRWELEKDYGIGAGGFYMKHFRYRDPYIVRLIMQRWWGGMLHLLYGCLTLRKVHVRLGWYRIVYSIAGMWLARNMDVSAEARLYEQVQVGG